MERQVHRKVLTLETAGTTATFTPAHLMPSGFYLLQLDQRNTQWQLLVVRE